MGGAMAKEKVTFSEWDIADYLKSEEDIRAYLDVVAEDNDAYRLTRALRDVARARDVSNLLQELIETLSADDNPSLDTTTKVLSAFGLRLTFAAAVKTKDDEK
jgi:probable addiction module antidote protein